MRNIIILIYSLFLLLSCVQENKAMSTRENSNEKLEVKRTLLTHGIHLEREKDVHEEDVYCKDEDGEGEYKKEIKEEARLYYNTKLSDSDFRNFSVVINGFRNLKIGEQRRCYNITVKYDIYKNEEWIETHYKNWYWDMNEKKCFWYSDISVKGKVGMLTSVIYVDVTEDPFAKKVMQILEKNTIE